MNILMTLSQLEVTGAEVYAVTIANELVKKGHNVFIVSDTLTKSTLADYVYMPLAKRTLAQRLKNVRSLTRFIKQNNIQIVHAHSRASAWVSSFACKICRIPLVATIHGRQATFLSRKLFKGFGTYTLAVCEEISKQLIKEFNVPAGRLEVLRNGFKIEGIENNCPGKNEKIVTYITRLSGPKGDLALRLLEEIEKKRHLFKDVHFRVTGGQTIPDKFLKFKDKFEFTGYVDDLKDLINNSSLIIGSGRIAVESLLMGKPTIAVGEATGVGLVNNTNIDFAMQTNFGDMAEYEKVYDFERLLSDIEKGLKEDGVSREITEKIIKEFNIDTIVKRIEFLYQSILVRFHKYEIPVVMYHRLITSLDEAGKHGIYVTVSQFEEHMNYLKTNGYISLDFNEAMNINRLDRKNKYIIITFDDGYEDNFRLAFPILKKYGFKAVIFLVAGIEYNKWDSEKTGEQKLTFMNTKQLIEMQEYGIVFGSHTMTHPDLSSISNDQLNNELAESKRILEKELGSEVSILAYPYGSLNEKVKEAAFSAGYSFAAATDSGPVALHEDLMQIRRIAIFPNTDKLGFSRKVKGNYVFRKIKDPSLIINIPKNSIER